MKKNNKKSAKMARLLAIILCLVQFCTVVPCMGVLPVFAADGKDEEIITETRMFKASDFTYSDTITVTDTKSGIAVSNNITWDSTYQKGHNLTATFKVDLDKTPLLTLSAMQCAVQYDAMYRDEEEGIDHFINQSKDAAEWRWGNNDHVIDLTDRHGWTGVHTITVTLRYIVWNPKKSAEEEGSHVNNFTNFGFKQRNGDSEVITSTRMLGPDDFNYPSNIIMEETGMYSFSVSNNFTWSSPVKKGYHMTTTVKVDVDKVPLFIILPQSCDVQYDITYKAEDGVVHYLNQDGDKAEWRKSSKGHMVNLAERHGWTGVHTIAIDFCYILWDTPAAAEDLYSVVNTFSYFGFKQIDTFTVSELYQDNAILQRDMPITISGEAKKDVTVSAKLFKTGETTPIAEGNASADENGQYCIVLPAQKGGYETYEMIITDGTQERKMSDLLFGEVWISGGQSNMFFKLEWSVEGQAMTEEDATDPYLRAFRYQGTPSAWVKGDNLARISNISAVAYHFAVELRKQLNVPVAVVDTAVGSTNIYAWVSKETIDNNAIISKYATARSNTSIGTWFDTSIKPLGGYTMRGMIWYQGEANCGDTATYYSRTMALLRKDWGDLFGWKDATMPLIVSNIAPHFYLNEREFDEPPTFSEELTAIVNAAPEVTAQIAIYDLPLEYKSTSKNTTFYPIHPSIKTDVGLRFANAALAMLYNIGTEATSPVFKSMRVEGDDIYITFDHVGDGLACLDKEIKGFAIRSGITYVPAHAEIVSKDTVKLNSPYVKNPIAATYAWTMMNQKSNLVSTKDGETLFAVVPFRTTDDKNVNYYRPHDWTYCDDEKLWRSNCSTADYYDAWLSTSGTISFDTEIVYRGDASLKLDYTADKDGLVTVSPSLVSGLKNGNDYDTDYSKFRIVRFYVKNDSDKELKVKAIRFTTANGRVCEAAVDVVVPANSAWTPVRAEIENNLRSDDAIVKMSLLKTVQAIDFVYETEANAKGVLHMDDIILSAEIADEPVEDAEITDEPVDNTDVDEKNGYKTILLIGAAFVAVIIALVVAIVLKKKLIVNCNSKLQ